MNVQLNYVRGNRNLGLRLIGLFGLVLLGWVRILPAETLILPIDSALSRVNLSLDALNKTDSAVSGLEGSVTIDLDSLSDPKSIAVGDFAISATDVMHFKLNFGLLGQGTARVNQLDLRRYDVPTTPSYVPITNAQFVVTNLSYTTHGDGHYAVTGLPCSLVQAAGRPCEDDVDFDSGPPGVIQEANGRIEVSNGAVRLDLTYFFTQPLDPESPDLATISGTVTLVAKGSPSAPVRLEISAGSGFYLLRWPKSASQAKLVVRPNLFGAGDWRAIARDPVENGDWLEVQVPATTENRFYRLE